MTENDFEIQTNRNILRRLRRRSQKPENLRELRDVLFIVFHWCSFLFIIFPVFLGREADLLVAGVDNEGPSLYFMADILVPAFEECLQ